MEIKTYSERVAADLEKGVLEKYHIPAIILSDDCGEAYPYLASTQGVKLIVNDKDVALAKKILSLGPSHTFLYLTIKQYFYFSYRPYWPI